MNITYDSNLWAKQAYRDLHILDEARRGDELVFTEELGGCMRKLSEDSIVRNAFLLADVSVVRQWWLLKTQATNEASANENVMEQ